jgi:hypothetical protein
LSYNETSSGLILNGGRHKKGSEKLKKFEWETVRERQIIHGIKQTERYKRKGRLDLNPAQVGWVCGLCKKDM